MMRDVTVKLPNGTEVVAAFGTRISTLLKRHVDPNLERMEYDDDPVVGVLVNNSLQSLASPVETPAVITPVRLFSHYGKRIYRHSICYFMAMAASRVIPDRRLVIGHSLGDGYYFNFDDELPVTAETAGLIEAEMRRIQHARYPVQHLLFSYGEALEFFESKGISDTALLLSYQNDPKIQLYECDGFLDLAYEPLIPNTRLADRFEVNAYGGSGLLLRYPREKDFRKLSDFDDNPVLFRVYQDHKKWGSIVNVNCVGQLNRLCDDRKAPEFIQISEAYQNKKISRIAENIASRKGTVKTVLIAGPSSSGKTTFTKKLGIQLKVLGFEPIEISLDNYYLPPSKAPLDEEGNPDLEALEAIDVQKVNEDLLDLFAGKAIDLIEFDFISHARSTTGTKLQLKENSLIIMEGIHGLNPGLTPAIPREAKYQIYISALTQLNLDDHNRISTTDNRMIRRIVRDHLFRGMSARSTIGMWPSVHRGEKHYIFPYQNNADEAFNSALDYELAVLKIYAEPLLKSIKPSDTAYTEAQRLMAFLENFYQIPPEHVPKNSLLREFIGGSRFSY